MTVDLKQRLAAAADLAPQPRYDHAALRARAAARRRNRRFRAAAVIAAVAVAVPAGGAVRGLLPDSDGALSQGTPGSGAYADALPPPDVPVTTDDVAFAEGAVAPAPGTPVVAVAQATWDGDVFTLLRYRNASGQTCFGWKSGGATSISACAPDRPEPFGAFGTGPSSGADGEPQVVAGWALADATTARVSAGPGETDFHVYRDSDGSGTYFVAVVGADTPVSTLDVLDREGRRLAGRSFTPRSHDADAITVSGRFAVGATQGVVADQHVAVLAGLGRPFPMFGGDDLVATASTDTEGRFALLLPPGEYSVGAYSVSFARGRLPCVTRNVVVRASAPPAELLLTCDKKNATPATS
jgi:hypothetical protein